MFPFLTHEKAEKEWLLFNWNKFHTSFDRCGSLIQELEEIFDFAKNLNLQIN